MDIGGIIVLVIVGFIIFSLCGWCCRRKYKGAVLSRPTDINVNVPYPVQQTVPMPHNVALPTAYPVQAYHPAYQPVRFAPPPDIYVAPTSVVSGSNIQSPPPPGVAVYPPPAGVTPYPPAAPYSTGAPYPPSGAPYPPSGTPYPPSGAPYHTGVSYPTGAPYPTGPSYATNAPYPPAPASGATVPVGAAPVDSNIMQPKLPSYQEAISSAPPLTTELYSKQAPYNPNY